ncbi:MAG: hypothetical protein H8D97_00140 [Proteobacteria bacterium]|nr:hypothetical protein [Pseudomonadota bacterium]
MIIFSLVFIYILGAVITYKIYDDNGRTGFFLIWPLVLIIIIIWNICKFIIMEFFHPLADRCIKIGKKYRKKICKTTI